MILGPLGSDPPRRSQYQPSPCLVLLPTGPTYHLNCIIHAESWEALASLRSSLDPTPKRDTTKIVSLIGGNQRRGTADVDVHTLAADNLVIVR